MRSARVLPASKICALTTAQGSAHLLRPAISADVVDNHKQHMLRDRWVHQVVRMHRIQYAVHLHSTAQCIVSAQPAHRDPIHSIARRSLHWCLQGHLGGQLHIAVSGWRHLCAFGKDVMLGSVTATCSSSCLFRRRQGAHHGGVLLQVKLMRRLLDQRMLESAVEACRRCPPVQQRPRRLTNDLHHMMITDKWSLYLLRTWLTDTLTVWPASAKERCQSWHACLCFAQHSRLRSVSHLHDEVVSGHGLHF